MVEGEREGGLFLFVLWLRQRSLSVCSDVVVAVRLLLLLTTTVRATVTTRKEGRKVRFSRDGRRANYPRNESECSSKGRDEAQGNT